MQNPLQNLVSHSELAILRLLSNRHTVNTAESVAEVNDISTMTGIRDSDEVIRALYTLEGKSLVSPEPAGDFTSNQWRITDFGRRALGSL